MYTKILVMQGIRTNNFSLSSSFCLSFFFLLNFLFLPSCRVRPLTFPSSLSESPLLGHQSSDAARWKHNLLSVQHVNLFHWSKMEPSCIFLIIFQMLITLTRNCLQLERQWALLWREYHGVCSCFPLHFAPLIGLFKISHWVLCLVSGVEPVLLG